MRRFAPIVVILLAGTLALPLPLAPAYAVTPGELDPTYGTGGVAEVPAHDEDRGVYSIAVVRRSTQALVAWRNVGPDVRTASVGGLVNGVGYDVYVVPANGVGFGAAAIATSVTPATGAPASQPPTVPWATAVPFGSSAAVSWGAAVEHGAEINGYHVLVVRDGVLTTWVPFDPAVRSATVPVGTTGTADVYVIASSGDQLGPLVGPLRVRG